MRKSLRVVNKFAGLGELHLALRALGTAAVVHVFLVYATKS